MKDRLELSCDVGPLEHPEPKLLSVGSPGHLLRHEFVGRWLRPAFDEHASWHCGCENSRGAHECSKYLDTNVYLVTHHRTHLSGEYSEWEEYEFPRLLSHASIRHALPRGLKIVVVDNAERVIAALL